MNLKDPRQVSELLRRIEGDILDSLKHLEHGYMGQLDFSRELVTKLSRVLSAIAEHIDPEMTSESLEPYKLSSLLPKSETLAPSAAKDEVSYLIDIARASAQTLEAGGDIDSARFLRVVIIEGLEAMVA